MASEVPIEPVPPTSSRQLRIYAMLGHAETGIYATLGVLLGAAALLAILGSLHLFADGVADLSGTNSIFLLIDRLLLVLLLVELLHTVRISIRSHTLVVEPFLIIGLIAIIRRTLVLTLQAESFTENKPWSSDAEAHFHASMAEAATLALLISVLVVAIFLLRTPRRGRPPSGAENNA